MKRTRNTPQRQAVLDAIRALDGQHPTAAEVFTEVRHTSPRISLATVYRALDTLSEQKQVIEIRLDTMSRYDASLDLHHHIICRQCGSVTDVCEEALPVTLYRKVEKCSGYIVADDPIQFYGICPNCAPVKRDTNSPWEY
jgi:Fur family transcriptional regulator, peroxide stress response regulator